MNGSGTHRLAGLSPWAELFRGRERQSGSLFLFIIHGAMLPAVALDRSDSFVGAYDNVR